METDELVRQIQQGKTELYSELWEQKRGLIIWFAKQYYSSFSFSGIALGVEFETEKGKRKYLEDFEQAGFLGLAKAVQYYDSERNGSFNELLRLCLLGEFQSISIGRSIKQRKDPLLRCLSLDIPINEDDPEGATRSDFVPDYRDEIADADERVYQEQLHDALERVLNTLPEKQAQAIRLEYWDGCTLKETAERMGCSTVERARQLRDAGFQRIRTSSASKQLEQFLDENINYYQGTSFSTYRQTNVRQVERMVFQREHLRKKYQWIMQEEKRGST